MRSQAVKKLNLHQITYSENIKITFELESPRLTNLCYKFANAKKTKAASLDSSYTKKVKKGVKVEVKVTGQDKAKGIVNISASILPGGTDKGSVTYDNKGSIDRNS